MQHDDGPPELRESWSPPWAPFIEASYTLRAATVEGEDDEPEPQRIEARCTKCGDVMLRKCASGRVRKHIVDFAVNHLHGLPLREEDAGLDPDLVTAEEYDALWSLRAVIEAACARWTSIAGEGELAEGRRIGRRAMAALLEAAIAGEASAHGFEGARAAKFRSLALDALCASGIPLRAIVEKPLAATDAPATE